MIRLASGGALGGFVGALARGVGSGRDGAPPPSSVLSALRWLWRRGNRARRYAKLKGTRSAESDARTDPPDHPRQVGGERPPTENQPARSEPCNRLPHREANSHADETR